jgi:hypothetical protein
MKEIVMGIDGINRIGMASINLMLFAPVGKDKCDKDKGDKKDSDHWQDRERDLRSRARTRLTYN